MRIWMLFIYNHTQFCIKFIKYWNNKWRNRNEHTYWMWLLMFVAANFRIYLSFSIYLYFLMSGYFMRISGLSWSFKGFFESGDYFWEFLKRFLLNVHVHLKILRNNLSWNNSKDLNCSSNLFNLIFKISHVTRPLQASISILFKTYHLFQRL